MTSSITILAAASTTSVEAATAAFIDATDHNGAYAPCALRELTAGQAVDRYSLHAAVEAANAIAYLRAGGSISWPNEPAMIRRAAASSAPSDSPDDHYSLLRQISGLDPVRRYEVYTFGSGRSRVALIRPDPPPAYRRPLAPEPETYTVVVYIVEDDGSPRDTWSYRTDPVNRLHEESGSARHP